MRYFRFSIGLVVGGVLLAAAPTEHEPVSLQTRVNASGERSLLVEAIGRLEGRVVDEVAVELSRDAVRQVSAPHVPPGWSFSLDGRTARLQGPPPSTASIRFRLQVGNSGAPTRLRVELRSAGRRIFRKNVPVVQLPAITVANTLQGTVVFPQAASPGGQVELQVLDSARTPEGGAWAISGQVAEEFRRTDESDQGESPWIRVRLPQDLQPGDPIAVSYVDPWGERLVDVEEAENVTVTAPPPEAPPNARLAACAPRALAGQTVCVCGWFPGETSRHGLQIQGQRLTTVSASSRVLNLRIPPDTPPGTYLISGVPGAGFPDSDGVEVLVLVVEGQIDQNELLRGQTTAMILRVLGTEDPVSIHLKETTGVVSLEGGADQVVETSGGPDNHVERRVRAVRPGNFNIVYRLEADPCPCATESLPSVPTSAAPAQEPRVESVRPGDGIGFELVVENTTDQPQQAVIYDPLPEGASHIDPASVQVSGSQTDPVNESNESSGLVIRGITVPPRGRVTVKYTIFVAQGAPQGFTVTNSARVNGVPTDPVAAPPVSNPESQERPLRSTKRYTGTRPGGPPRPTIPVPFEPGVPPVTTPPEGPPVRPPPETCDCCCYKNLIWTVGNPISGDIVVPSNSPVDVELGEKLPIAAEAFDSDLLTILCERRGCGEKPCPACASKTTLQMADRLVFHWKIVSGPGMIDTRPHLHSNERLSAAAVFVAPDQMPNDPNVVVELTIDDGPEKLTDVDDAPVKKQLRIRLVPAGPGNANLNPKSVSPGPVITPGAGDPCPCRPHYRWTVGDRLKAEILLPQYVCEKGFDTFSAPGFDSDVLTAGCKGGCSTSSSDAVRRLIDPLYYRWSVSSGSILGGAREEVVFRPAAAGPVDVKLRVQDSGTQFSDPVVDLEGSVTVVGIDPSESGDYIVPFSKENIVRYVVKPEGLSADDVILEVIDKDGKLMRRLDDLPTSNDVDTGYAEYKWDGLTQFGTPLTEAASPYTYRITMIKGEARCRLKIKLRKVKEWDLSYNIVDRGQQLAGRKAGASGIDVKTVVPTLVLTKVKPDGGDEVRVPVYEVEEQEISSDVKLAKVKLMSSFKQGDRLLVYTSPTAPNTIGYTVAIESKEGGALDKAGNEWDMDPDKEGIQRTQIWKFRLDAEGKYQDFQEEIKD